MITRPDYPKMFSFEQSKKVLDWVSIHIRSYTTQSILINSLVKQRGKWGIWHSVERELTQGSKHLSEKQKFIVYCDAIWVMCKLQTSPGSQHFNPTEHLYYYVTDRRNHAVPKWWACPCDFHLFLSDMESNSY